MYIFLWYKLHNAISFRATRHAVYLYRAFRRKVEHWGSRKKKDEMQSIFPFPRFHISQIVGHFFFLLLVVSSYFRVFIISFIHYELALEDEKREKTNFRHQLNKAYKLALNESYTSLISWTLSFVSNLRCGKTWKWRYKKYGIFEYIYSHGYFTWE